MNVRTAAAADVPAMHRVRFAVRENRLSDSTPISEHSYLPHVATGGAWVAEVDGRIVGFAAIYLSTNSVWALFVHPDAEGLGLGRALHEHMLRWSSDQGMRQLWLTTSPGTRAEIFYRRLGWFEAPSADSGDVRFERQLD